MIQSQQVSEHFNIIEQELTLLRLDDDDKYQVRVSACLSLRQKVTSLTVKCLHLCLS